MIDARQAVAIAKEQATTILGPSQFSLEEIERDVYKTRDVWKITLGQPRWRLGPFQSVVQPTPDQLDYKFFLIDVESGELVAMKLREVAFP